MRRNFLAALLITGILAITNISLAEKPAWAGGNKNGNKHEQNDSSYQSNEKDDRHSDDNSNRNHQSNKKNYQYSDHRNRNGHDGKRNTYFKVEHRYVINNYYTEYYSHGHCPPGLIRKHDGCRPRGHARNWQVGRQLPREVIFYDIDPQVTVLLGPPPSHHRYVRVASDILLITIGTGMVVDAIQDLNGM